MRVSLKSTLTCLSFLLASSVAPGAAAQSKAGALPVEPPGAAARTDVVLWDRISIDGEHIQQVQARIESFDGKWLQAGGRRYAVALASGTVFDYRVRPVALEKALVEHPRGLCALVQYVPARLSALGADTVTGVILLVNEEGALLERCPDEREKTR